MSPFRSRDPRLLRVALVGLLLALFFLSLIILAGCSASRTGKALNVAVIGATTADYVTTRQVIHRGGYELNPVLGNGAIRQALVKAGLAGAVIALTRSTERQRPILAHVLRSAAIVVWSVGAWHNHGVLR